MPLAMFNLYPKLPTMSHQLFDHLPKPTQQPADCTVDDNAYAQRAHRLIASIKARHGQLADHMQRHSRFQRNPLGTAMCQDIEYRMHQIVLLISSQQKQLVALMKEHSDRVASEAESMASSSSSSSSSATLRDWAEVREGARRDLSPQVGANYRHDISSDVEWPRLNSSRVIRMTALKSVIDFSVNELKSIEDSDLLTTYPAKEPSRQ